MRDRLWLNGREAAAFSRIGTMNSGMISSFALCPGLLDGRTFCHSPDGG
jgi:hypothetical protein